MSLLRPAKDRLAEVLRLSKAIFHESHNPSHERTGGKVLRQLLRGPHIKDYYKPRPSELTLRYLNTHVDRLTTHYDAKEERRLEKIAIRQRKGKGKPTKAKGPPVDTKKKKK